MKHFIMMAVLGTAAVGSGMMIASHYGNPGAGVGSLGTPSVSMASMGSKLPSFPDHMPGMNEALGDAGHAFGSATQTAARYSDATFGPTANRAKQSVDAMRSSGTH